MDTERPLTALREGESGRVARLTGSPGLCRRLAELGLIPGTPVSLFRRSPAGDPSAYLFRGAVVALRRADAAGIWLDAASGEVSG